MAGMTRLLVVEDDEDIRDPLTRALTREGYDVAVATDGPSALAQAEAEPFSLMVLDLGLPGLDGLEVCRRVRAIRPELPILMLTARADEIDLVVGLDSGADDYVGKPFRVAELLARIRALLRRAERSSTSGPELVFGPLRLELAARRVWLGGAEVDLAPKEFELLAVLARSAGTVVTRERLIDEVWDEHWFGPTKTLDMHISSLRKKLGDDPTDSRFITTVRGVGYRFERAAD